MYDFIKDGLLEKVGIVKVWWEETEEEEEETYYDLSDDQYSPCLLSKCWIPTGRLEIVEHTVNNEPEAIEPKEEAEASS
jgi:hypothetical protein